MDIGIDLGTTFSVIAVAGRVELAPDYPAGLYLDECDVTIIPTPYGDETFPSVVIDDPERPGEHLFGLDAAQQAQEGRAPVMFSKRKIGTREGIPLGEGEVLARDVAALFLAYLKQCAEQALGRPVERAVVTHPAYFDRGAVEETREAAVQAGFDMSEPDQMLMEPVAAALAYARTDARDPLRILTYDLGGGTFDVTYLERRGGVIDMRAFDGNHLLGGFNFDRELVYWLRQRLEAQGRWRTLDEEDPDDRGRLARLLQAAETVKLNLAGARSDTTPVDFRLQYVLTDAQGRPLQVNERLTRAEFVELLQPYLQDTLDGCRRALRKAGVEADALDEVLLVGGSSQAPWVAACLAAEFAAAEPRLFSPSLCVGAGAAIHARAVLPPRIDSSRYRVLLDAPETSVLDLLNLAGSITDAAGQPLSGSLLAVLTDPLGRASEASSVADGRFLFADVELPDEGVNHFRLALAREDGVTVLTHEFDIAYRPEDGGSSTIRTVLPRMLSIETVDGLVPLADEGVALPARVSCTLQRENDNPNISLRLFQETEPIGEIRIEGIPPEGGRGSLVDLTVEVTAKNQIRGMAAIRTRDGRIVADQRISVRLEMPEVPSAADLADELGNLQLQWLLNEQGGVDTTNAIAETVATQFAAAARVLDQQPVDRQELHAALRRLRLLVNPPDDDMRPTRREYLECVEQCRAALRETVEKAEAVAAETDEPVPDERKAAHAAELKARAERYLEMVGRLEQEGLKAHGARDRRMLARLHDQLTDIEATVRDRSRPLEAPPNFIGKFMGIMEIMRLRDRLNDAVRHLSQREHVHLEDWSETVSRLEAGLDAAMREVEAIDDELTGEQTMAQVRRLHSRILNALERDIDLLGQDASRV